MKGNRDRQVGSLGNSWLCGGQVEKILKLVLFKTPLDKESIAMEGKFIPIPNKPVEFLILKVLGAIVRKVMKL